MHVSPNQVLQRNMSVQQTAGAQSAPSDVPDSVQKNMAILNAVNPHIRDQTMSTQGLGVQEMSKMPCWFDVFHNVDQATLSHAHRQMNKFVDTCAQHGLSLTTRPEKQLSRIQEKHRAAQANLPRAGFVDDFKVVSDFMAGRDYCNITDIQSHVDTFKKLANEQGGWCVVRGEGKDTFGAHQKEGVLKDIVQYVFVFLPDMGHVTECQIGHQLAGVTFTIDSFLRDNKGKIPESDLPIDLWGNKEAGTNLYGSVRDYLLLQANEPTSVDLAARKQECLDIAGRLYTNGTIPSEVKEILDAL